MHITTNQFRHAPSHAPFTMDNVGMVLRSHLVLRIGAALCFIGHGAFGFITKAEWLPYFAVAGIPESVSWPLMPLVGAVDVLAGMAVLFAPRRLPLLYMSVWALWTALLRPLAGESVFELVERAGNYGVPFALLLLSGFPDSWQSLVTRINGAVADPRNLQHAVVVLKWTTVFLLAGHGALGALVEKATLTSHYLNIGLPAATTVWVGWFELALACAIAFRPAIGLLLFACTWKFGTESLYIANGAPIWEFVERFGSYAAPLALVALLAHQAKNREPEFDRVQSQSDQWSR